MCSFHRCKAVIIESSEVKVKWWSPLILIVQKGSSRYFVEHTSARSETVHTEDSKGIAIIL